jgi:penicillin-binding protein 1C
MKRKWIFGVFLLLLLGSILAGYFWLFGDLPKTESLPQHLATPSIRITDRHGQVLYDALPVEGGRHTPVPLKSIPLALQQATIATEDHHFYSNPGIDLQGVLRSIWINLRGGETLAGGSTITQQVARNLLLGSEERFERSIRRKIREAVLAWQLTRQLSKDEILGLYLNQIYYGGFAYGVEAAAQTFFAKPVSELDLAECALLAGLPQSPALYNPLVEPQAAKDRQLIVLKLMLDQGLISQEVQDLASREPLSYASTPYPIEAPHFVMMVQNQIDQLLEGQSRWSFGGLVVRTTLDLDWQHHAEEAIQRQLQNLRDDKNIDHNVNNAALVALDPLNGEILALVGSPDYFDAEHSGAVNMVISPRQPGSSIKPLVYAAAFNPMKPDTASPGVPWPWTAATMILDVSTTFTTHDGKAYTPANYDSVEHGPVLARQALASSLNIPAVITLDHIGLGTLFNLGTNLGITTLGNPQDFDLSLALGGGEVRLLELTAAYGAFANQGYRLYPQAIIEIKTLSGEVIYQADPQPRVRAIDERVAWLISDILSDNDARSLGFGINSALHIDRPAAVKTGTTTNFHDNWTVGYTPNLVVGVWVGNTNHEPMRDVTGLSGAAPIWHQFIRTVLTGTPEYDFIRPPGLIQVEVCALSGLLPTEDCPYRRREWFIDGTQPVAYDNIYHSVIIDTQTGSLANDNTPLEQRRTQIALDLPPQASPWAHQHGLILLSDLVSGSTVNDGNPGNGPSRLMIASPGTNAVYLVSETINTDIQRIHIQAIGDPEIQNVTLWLDGQVLGIFNQPPYELWWPLEIGDHTLWAEGTNTNGDLLTSPRINFSVEVAGDSQEK